MPGLRAPSRPRTSTPKRLAKETGQGAAVIDLDGTLVSFRLDPEAVKLSQAAARALASLARTRPVVIVSGRPLAFLRRVTAGLPLLLVGSHGAEASIPGVSLAKPKSLPAKLERVMQAAEKRGLRVERKPFGRAIHFRELPEAAREAEAAVWLQRLEAALPAGFEVLRGNAVLEARPKGVHKGAVFPALRAAVGAPIAVTLGDDRTDEDMFAALLPGELGVLVGPPRPSLAPYRLPGVTAVQEYLSVLAAARALQPR